MPACTQSPARYRELGARHAQPTRRVGSGRLDRLQLHPLEALATVLALKPSTPPCAARRKNQAGGAPGYVGILSQPCTQYRSILYVYITYKVHIARAEPGLTLVGPPASCTPAARCPWRLLVSGQLPGLVVRCDGACARVRGCRSVGRCIAGGAGRKAAAVTGSIHAQPEHTYPS